MEYSSKSISKTMLKDHKKILDLIQEFEKQTDSFKAREILEKFKWNLEKHFFMEEKVIFSVYQIENNEEDEDVINLLKEHKDALFLIKKIEELSSKDKKADITELKLLLINHANFENKSFYPRLDEELTEEQKQMIIERADEEIKNRYSQ
jgi:hypothetical protein